MTWPFQWKQFSKSKLCQTPEVKSKQFQFLGLYKSVQYNQNKISSFLVQMDDPDCICSAFDSAVKQLAIHLGKIICRCISV